MNYYDVLGVNPTCSPDEIQTAYRKLAKKYHPDLGGDENMFHTISEAYDTLKDPHSRAEFDHKNSRRQPQPDIKYKEDVFDDLFTIFGSNGQPKRQYTKQYRNKNLSITVEVELHEVLVDFTKTISVKHMDGSRHIVNVKIPAGIKNGTKINYSGLGDYHYKDLEPGNLTVTVKVNEHKIFTRNNNNLHMNFTITAWDAIIGNTVNIITIENKTLNLNIPAGTQYGTTLKIHNHGLIDKSKNRGDLFVNILIKIPENLTEEQLNICTKLRGKI